MLFTENTTLLKQIEAKIGMKSILKVLPELYNKEQIQNKNLTYFQKFLDILKSKNLISNNDLSEFMLLREQKNKKFTMKNSYNAKEKAPFNSIIHKNKSSKNLKDFEEKIMNFLENENELAQSEYSHIPSSVSRERSSNNISHTTDIFTKKCRKSFKESGNNSQYKKLNISFG